MENQINIADGVTVVTDEPKQQPPVADPENMFATSWNYFQLMNAMSSNANAFSRWIKTLKDANFDRETEKTMLKHYAERMLIMADDFLGRFNELDAREKWDAAQQTDVNDIPF